MVACLTHIAANYLTGRKEAKRWGTAHESIVPYQAFETKDGYLVVGTGNDQQFSVVCKILSLPSLSQEPRFKTNKLRVQNRRELIGILCARFRDKTTQNWLELFEGSGVPYGPINSIQQAFSEPQVSSLLYLAYKRENGTESNISWMENCLTLMWVSSVYQII
ncbi:hypothetical protein scyTo_0001588 [Scyliorhinus torazame]|uniref:Uncharacterized protein n=1 Tax=Scyliorhinus torazame TaxID=75743 RepID=A0A401PEF8_SCYTO|nr:hypothetical protein [Scyliorhinus torazame]